MRSISFATPFALLAVLLAGCPGDDKTETGNEETGGGTGDCTIDADGDGYNECEDCDDTSAMINPGAEEDCDGVDNDCDGELDEGVTGTYYQDADGDGFGDSGVTTDACEASDGWVPVDGDCDDADPYVYPGAEEICDGTDNDCNDTIDDGLDTQTYYHDGDGDAYGDPNESIEACDMPDGYTDNADDCDDLNSMEPVHADSVSGSPEGTGTMTNPLDTIQGAIDLAEKCVYAMPGTYNENIDFTGKNILVKGVDGTDRTFIVGTGDGSVVTIASGETSEAILTGFTIMSGSGTVEVISEEREIDSYTTMTTTTYRYYGGGVYVFESSPTLYDLVITENQLPAYSYSNPSDTEEVYVYSYGGGLFAGDATLDAWDITFSDNYADNGGGSYSNDATTVAGKWFDYWDNSAANGGGASVAGTASFDNSIFAGNTSSSELTSGGAAVDVQGGSVTLNQVSTSNNDGVSSVYLSSGGSLTSYNSIVYWNDEGYMIDGETGTSLDVSYSDVYGGASGNYGSAYTDPTGAMGNISEDPEFTSATDLTLGAGSPAAGTGDGGVDMGAYGGADGVWDE